ncbi:MAG: ferritin-like domain-containing protein [Cytophagaceae bacterium]
MKINNLNDLFVDMLKDLYSAEVQLVKQLPVLAKKATTKELKNALEDHLQVTSSQRDRIEALCKEMNINPKGKNCAAMEGIVKEAEETVSEIESNLVMDAAIIAVAQKVEHYEIASYGTAVAFAKMLGNQQAQKVLHDILEEEKQADALLTKIAESAANVIAAQK